MTDEHELARRFSRFADDHGARAPFLASVAATIAAAPDVAAILGDAPVEQQLPVLLLAAIHDQVLAEPECDLAAWYPTVTAEPREDAVRDALLAHCRDRREELCHTVAIRSTQTNEVGRCGLLLPAFGLLQAELGALAWIDVGASAGLNLRLDRYEYDYQPGGRVGGGSPVRIEVGTRGRVPVPSEPPTFVRRIGIDRDPVEPDDPVAARWLRACVWADQVDRFRRLDAAIELAATTPVELHRGDAVDDLPTFVDGIAAGTPVVVTTTWVLPYLPDERRSTFVAMLDRIGTDRDLSWIYAESPADNDGVPFAPEVQGRTVTALGLVRWRGGTRRLDHLGVAHPHGVWLHWRDA